jgi:hypothetical protein
LRRAAVAAAAHTAKNGRTTYQRGVDGGRGQVIALDIQEAHGGVDAQRVDEVFAAVVVDVAGPQLQRQYCERLAQRLGQLARASISERVIRQIDVPKPTPT